jgi:hypothetical protein
MTTRKQKREEGEGTARRRLECVRLSAAFPHARQIPATDFHRSKRRERRPGPDGGRLSLRCLLLGLSATQSAGKPAQSKTWRPRLALLSLLPFVFCLIAAAQPYAIDWSTLDGGGGTSTGGVYSVSGTIGQPDAATMNGGQFTMQGGFWPGIVVSSPGEAPTLFIQLSGDSVIISWSPATPGFELEATADLGGAMWTPVLTTNPVTIPMTGPVRFYRLKKP